MASSAAGVLPQFASGVDSDDEDEDDDVVGANADNLDDEPMTSHDSGRLRQLPVTKARDYAQQQRQSHTADPTSSRRTVVTQHLGKQYPSISVVEEERNTDDDPEDDDVLGGSSTGTTSVAVDDGVPHYVVDFPRGSRMRCPRVSLLGRPLSYRSSRRDTRIKRLQNRIYVFLERPKTCASITYHTTVSVYQFILLGIPHPRDSR